MPAIIATVLNGKFLIRGKEGRMTVLNDYFALYPGESFAPINTNHADFTIKGNNTNELDIKTGSKGKVDIKLLPTKS